MKASDFWQSDNLRAAAGGTWLKRPARFREHRGVSIDSRSLVAGEVFLAIRGERFDAHTFLRPALERGASMLIIEDRRSIDRIHAHVPDSVGIVRVPSTIDALVRLAGEYRNALSSTKIVGVTGSNGKTTTVRMIQSLLSTRFQGVASRKSYNNIIGVPLTILSARPGDQYIVSEVGMNSPGEIEILARILQPDIAVITSIGRAHIENFDSINGIAQEKASLLAFLQPGGVAIVTADAPALREYLHPVSNLIMFGQADDADLRLTDSESLPEASGIRFGVNHQSTYEVRICGRHNALNALAAIAVARQMGLDDSDIRQGLYSVEAPDMRLQVITRHGLRVFNDAYNSSPESMIAAIEVFDGHSVHAVRRVMILGDMLELGRHADAAHLEVAEQILACHLPDLLVTVGEHSLLIAGRIAEMAPGVEIAVYGGVDESSARSIARRLRVGDTVLLKGSRRIGLERVLSALEDVMIESENSKQQHINYERNTHA